MADKKVSELSSITNLSSDDLLLVVNDPSGTPTSRKVTVGNLFANVVAETDHKRSVTFRANTFIRGTECVVSANLTMTGVMTVNTHDIVAEIVDLSGDKIGNTAARTLISDRLQVANATATFATKADQANLNSYVANTNPRITDLESNSLFYTTFGTLSQGSGLIYDGSTWRNTVSPGLQFNVGRASGNTAWTFDGSGAQGSNNETLYLYKGFTYVFDIDTLVTDGGNPERLIIRNSYGGTAFANGVSGNNATVQQFTVPMNQQSNLYYESSLNSSTMRGKLVIVT